MTLSSAKMEDKNFRYIVRIANTDLDGNKPVFAALRKIKGVSFSFSNMVCNMANVDFSKKAGNLTEDEVKVIESTIKKVPETAPSWMLNRRKDYENGENMHLLGADLDFAKDQDIRRMKKVRSYRGMRHGLKLPVRGQRTRSNFRKNKGKVMGVTKQKAAPAKKGEGKEGKGKKG